MTAPLTIRNLADAFSLAPRLIGYDPTGKAVVLLFQPGGRVGALAADLPALDDPDVVLTLAEFLTGKAKAAGAEAALMLQFTDEPDDVGAGLFALAFGIAAAKTGLQVAGMGAINSDYWMDFDDPGVERLLDEVTGSRVLAEAVFNGTDVALTEFTLPEPDMVTASRELRMLNLAARLPMIPEVDVSPAHLRLLDQGWDLWVRALGTEGELPEEMALQLVAYFQHKLFRDVFLCYLAGDTYNIETVSNTLNSVITDAKPELLPRAAAIRRTVLELLRWTPERGRPNLLAMLGFMEWFRGQGTVSMACYDKALEIQPDHRLASLLSEFARRGLLSPSACHPDASKYSHLN